MKYRPPWVVTIRWIRSLRPRSTQSPAPDASVLMSAGRDPRPPRLDLSRPHPRRPHRRHHAGRPAGWPPSEPRLPSSWTRTRRRAQRRETLRSLQGSSRPQRPLSSGCLWLRPEQEDLPAKIATSFPARIYSSTLLNQCQASSNSASFSFSVCRWPGEWRDRPPLFVTKRRPGRPSRAAATSSSLQRPEEHSIKELLMQKPEDYSRKELSMQKANAMRWRAGGTPDAAPCDTPAQAQPPRIPITASPPTKYGRSVPSPAAAACWAASASTRRQTTRSRQGS
jgi:hypothetical protein